jgi:glutaredoxin
MARKPPAGPPYRDTLATQCGVRTITYSKPIPPGTRCHYCGLLANTRDHIVPDTAGGSRSWWNLVPACADCNLAKADRQACACMFCVRAMALWHFGYRRTGQSWAEIKARKKANREAREMAAPTRETG